MMLLLLACSPPPAAPPEPTPPPPPVEPVITPPPPPEVLPPAFATPPTPPKSLGAVYVDKGVCPGECCTYQEWTARRATPIVASPGSTEVRGTVNAGEKVAALRGEVHTTAIPARVLQDRTLGEGKKAAKVKTGDTVWVLTALGEGYAKIWVNGKVVETEALFVYEEDCHRPEPGDHDLCWAVSDAQPGKRDPWWVEVRTAAGVQGWVENSAEPLTGFDACG